MRKNSRRGRLVRIHVTQTRQRSQKKSHGIVGKIVSSLSSSQISSASLVRIRRVSLHAADRLQHAKARRNGVQDMIVRPNVRSTRCICRLYVYLNQCFTHVFEIISDVFSSSCLESPVEKYPSAGEGLQVPPQELLSDNSS